METTPVKSTCVQRSESEIRALLKEQEEGNVTVKEFCEIYGIHAATLYNWRKKYNLKTEKEPFDGVTTMILKVQV